MNIADYSLWTALVSPLNPDFTPDLVSLSNLLTEQKQANLGLTLLGSTAESLNLSTTAKKNILESSLEHKLNLPVMVGVPGHDLAASLEWLDYLETLPIHAYLMITPIYARPSDEGQYQWFKTLMDRVSRPVMLYNVPKRCGTSLSLNAVERLRDHKNYWAIKEASGSVEQFAAYVKASGGQPVFCGDDQLFPDFAKAGSCGLISVASNIWPLGVKIFTELCLANTLVDNNLWHEACEQLFKATNPVGIKRLLADEKRITNKLLMPPLSHLDCHNADELMRTSALINEWMRKYI